jgi:hypothetical protein
MMKRCIGGRNKASNDHGKNGEYKYNILALPNQLEVFAQLVGPKQKQAQFFRKAQLVGGFCPTGWAEADSCEIFRSAQPVGGFCPTGWGNPDFLRIFLKT